MTLTSKFVFPENASYLYCTFSRCTNLVTAPVIPSTGSTMYSLFAGCTSLTGIVEINTENDYYYTMCFQGVDFETQNLTLTGTATFLDKVGATGTNYCDVCNGRHKTSEEEHTCHGGTATCIEKAICMICNKSYGDLAICFAENISNGNCSLCGKTATAIESAHNPYPNSQNYIVIGTWDYHDAKSVNITLIYQFESIHYDWFSLAEGTDFISESSYNELRRYFTKYGSVSNNLTSSSSYTKFSSTTKTTQTFENVNMLTGSVVLKTNDTNNNYYGVTVIVTPNY